MINWWNVGQSRKELKEQLKRVTEEIGSITGDMMDDRPAAVSSTVAATTKIDVVVGLDDDLLEIKGRLCGGSTKLEIIPIVGMGGIGKTTLAQKAYADALIMEYFDIRLWVTVSQDYSVDEILLSLAGFLVSEEMLEKDEALTEEKVYKSLKGRRYLVVMDDIWSSNVWDDVRSILPDDKNGSRVMLTSRLSDVAAYASSGSPVHEMKFMDGHQSWNLLKQIVFTDGEDCLHELEEIGKEIAGGCRGLPLAVVLVAGILSTVVKTRASWEKVAKSVTSNVDGQLDEILSLSYRVLPHHLRPCFLFMAGFPEDHTMYASRLIKLWVAEGFLKHQNEYKSLEEEAEKYLEDLVKRSLVLITTRKSNGKIKSCRLHDLVRDMCIRKAQEEKFLVTDKYALPIVSMDERRIGICHSRLDFVWSPTIHTILCYFPNTKDFSLLDFVVNFRLLRVLDVMHYPIVLHSNIFELFHLRYLAVGLRNKIPGGISKLENLQTFIIHIWKRLKSSTSAASYLPMEIWWMQHLRHLVFFGLDMLPHPVHHPTLIPLHNLQTLSGVASFVCSKRILEMIPNLKKLGIVYTSIEEHHQLHNLVYLHQLEKLKITASSWQGQCPVFPRALKKLTLVGGRLPWKDMSIVGSLSYLEVLKLKNHTCDGDSWETNDGEFRQLKYLLIEHSNLKHLKTESIHFPRLKRLVVKHCWYLSEISESFGEIPTLEMIEVETLNESLVKSIEQILEDQRNCGNEALHVRCNLHKQQDFIEKMKKLTGLEDKAGPNLPGF